MVLSLPGRAASGVRPALAPTLLHALEGTYDGRDTVTFTFKLARRTARHRSCTPRAFGAWLLAATMAGAACSPDAPTAPQDDPSSPMAEADPNPVAAGSPVPISPGQSIQAAVNSNPTGTQFLLKAGTHANQRIVPKSGNVFLGEPGTILDGKNATSYAFEKGGQRRPDQGTHHPELRLAGAARRHHGHGDLRLDHREL